MKVLTIFLFLIITEAWYESWAKKPILTNRVKRYLSGVIEFFYRAVLMLIVFAWFSNYIVLYFNLEVHSFWDLFVGYILLRTAILRPLYGLFSGEGYLYIGTTKLYDIWLAKFVRWTKQPPNILLPTIEFPLLLIGAWFTIYSPILLGIPEHL